MNRPIIAYIKSNKSERETLSTITYKVNRASLSNTNPKT